MRYAILFMAALAIHAQEPLIDIIKTHPESATVEDITFEDWKNEQFGKKVVAKVKWDGGHNGGYTTVKMFGKPILIHVDFIFTTRGNTIPKKPRKMFKSQERKCRYDERHYKPYGGKEITITGEILSIREPIQFCKCGKAKVFKLTIKAESVK